MHLTSTTIGSMAWRSTGTYEQGLKGSSAYLGKYAFAQGAPPVITTPNGLSLEDLLFPIAVHFRLQTVNGKAKMLRISSDQAASIPERDTKLKDDPLFEPDSEIPKLSAKDIQVLMPIDDAIG